MTERSTADILATDTNVESIEHERTKSERLFRSTSVDKLQGEPAQTYLCCAPVNPFTGLKALDSRLDMSLETRMHFLYTD